MEKMLIVTIISLMMGCGQSPSSADRVSGEASMAPTEMEEASAGTEKLIAFNENDLDDQNDSQTPASTQQREDKKIIRTANLRLELRNYATGRQKVDEIVKQYDGFISEESENRTNWSIENTMKIRLKPMHFDACLRALEEIAFNVQYKNVKAQDVTTQFIDMETRLAAKRAVVDQYQAILKQATTIKDIIEVQDKLRVIIEEIESIEGQLKYLRDQVGLSTIELTIVEFIEAAPQEKYSFFAKLSKAFVNGWEVLKDLIIGLANVWPLILILIAFIVYFVRLARRRNQPTKGERKTV